MFDNLTISKSLIEIDLPALLFPDSSDKAQAFASRLASYSLSNFLTQKADELLLPQELDQIKSISSPQKQTEKLESLVRTHLPNLDQELYNFLLTTKTSLIVKLLVTSNLADSEDQAMTNITSASDLESLIAKAVSHLSDLQLESLL